jgi:hypothetical protein
MTRKQDAFGRLAELRGYNSILIGENACVYELVAIKWQYDQ